MIKRLIDIIKDFFHELKNTPYVSIKKKILKINRRSLALMILSFLPIISIILLIISRILGAYNSKNNFRNLLMINTAEAYSYHLPKINWKQPFTHEGRPINLAGIEKQTKDYVVSYYHQFQALKTGETSGLKDYYTDKSRKHINELAAYHRKQGIALEGVTIAHDARLDFFSSDGIIMNITDNVISYQIQKVDGQVINRFYDTATYKVMLILEDNFWRVRQKIKTPLENSTIKLKINASKFPKNFKIKGLNYYPEKHPWQEMWINYDSIDFKSDFDLIKDLGFNTLRIFVPYHHFGGARLIPTEIEKLSSFLDLAHEYKFKIIVTLFDFFLGYQVEEWTLSDRHLEGIISKFSRHPAILGFDLKNEPDLDFERYGEDEVQAWLDFISKRLTTYDSSALQTVGWSQPEFAHIMKDQLDFLSFHFYREISELNHFLDSTNLNKPLFIGETGMHSFKKWWYPIGNTEDEQKVYYNQLFKIISAHNIHYAFWTLYDFKNIPSNVAGRWPWQKGPQKAYGLQNEGRKKPSLNLVKKFNLSNSEK